MDHTFSGCGTHAIYMKVTMCTENHTLSQLYTRGLSTLRGTGPGNGTEGNGSQCIVQKCSH